MKPLTFLVIAGDPSGDLAAADLVRALRLEAGPLSPRFVGAGGAALKAAGVELAFELTSHSVIGIEILARLHFFRQVFLGLLDLAERECPDVVIGVDYSGFNLRFAAELKRRVKVADRPFHNWNPKIVQYISPQVWASRPGRARTMERTHDLLLSILPFESAWFLRNAPRLKVKFVGHPLVDRRQPVLQQDNSSRISPSARGPSLVLLPGSRASELDRHLPVMVPAAVRVNRETGVQVKLVLPTEQLRLIAAPYLSSTPKIEVQIGELDEALLSATVALASTGTVTLECAWFGVPTVALYKTSPVTYQIGRRILTVSHLAMPNLLANETLIPEFIQNNATADALANAVLMLLRDEDRRSMIRLRLLDLARSLGEPGTGKRAAQAILDLF